MDFTMSDQDQELERLSSKLSENVAIVFTEEDLKEASAELEHTLVVRLVGDRAYNKVVFKEVLRKSWRVQGGVRFVEVENGMLLAKFNSKGEMERILQGGPWRYMGWAVMLDRWESGRDVQDLISHKLQLWMQVHRIPIEFRKEKFALRFAEKAGKVISGGNRREKETDGDARNVFIRFLVEIDMRKPVVPGWEMKGPDGKSHWIEFRYERLPNICFNCGRLEHEASQCKHEEGSSGRSRFGPWVRAEHIALERLGGVDRRWRKPANIGEDGRNLERREDVETGGTQEGEKSIQSQRVLGIASDEEAESQGSKNEESPRVEEYGANANKGKAKVSGIELVTREYTDVGLLLMGQNEVSFREAANGPVVKGMSDKPKNKERKRKAVQLRVDSDKVYRRKGEQMKRREREMDLLENQSRYTSSGAKLADGAIAITFVGSAPAGHQPRREQ